MDEINKDILFKGNGISGKLLIMSSFLIEIEIKVETRNEKLYIHKDAFSFKVNHKLNIHDKVESEKLSVSYEKKGLLDRIKDWEEIYLHSISCVEDEESGECKREKELLGKLKNNTLSVIEFKNMLEDLIVYMIVEYGSEYTVREVLNLIRKKINLINKVEINDAKELED